MNSNHSIISFEQIKNIRLKIKSKLEYIHKTKENIKQNYLLYIKNEHNNDFFGLDSFHFQNKLIEQEYAHVIKMYKFIDNRIYGDYYKLIIKIKSFMQLHLLPEQFDKIKELNYIQTTYPIYRDLNPYEEYDFDTIHNLHQDIIIILENATTIYNETKDKIHKYNEQIGLGMNIDNYIITNQHKNNQLITTIRLFNNYLNVYHKYHYELLYNYYEQLKLINKQINHKYEVNKSKRQSFINNNMKVSFDIDNESKSPPPPHHLRQPQPLSHRSRDSSLDENIIVSSSERSLSSNDEVTI